jgi:tryptophan synthase alpha chain
VLDGGARVPPRDNRTPVVLMGYANPIERYDQRAWRRAPSSAAAPPGVDGVLVVDYPPEECEAFAAQLKLQGMDLIFLLAPTSTDERMATSAASPAATCTTCRSRA